MAHLIVDGLILFLYAAIVIFYTYRGFVATLVGFLRFFIATGLAILFSPSIGTELQPTIENRLSIEADGPFFSSLLQEVVSSGYLAKALAFILVFMAASILIKLVELMVNAISKLPVINFINRTLGALLGILIGFFWVQLIAFSVVTLATYLKDTVTVFPEGTYQSTTVLKWLYEHNIFTWIVGRLLAALGR